LKGIVPESSYTNTMARKEATTGETRKKGVGGKRQNADAITLQQPDSQLRTSTHGRSNHSNKKNSQMGNITKKGERATQQQAKKKEQKLNYRGGTDWGLSEIVPDTSARKTGTN